jgi:dTDP-4-dehydrorhamnose reductase
VTEAHHGSTREEQLRWLMEVWNAASRLRGNGVDICAVTGWALFGAVDWNSLLTRNAGFYEPGAFDVRNRPPRLTVIGQAMQSLARNRDFDHPALAQHGWWRRPERLYRPTSRGNDDTCLPSRSRLLIAGDENDLARVFQTAVRMRGLEHIRLSRTQLDGLGPAQLASMISDLRPWALIDGRAIYGEVPSELGENLLTAACAKLEVPFGVVSGEPLAETLGYVAPSRGGATPVSRRDGWTELEQRVSLDHHQSLIVRADAGSVDVLLDLLIDGERGVWQPTNVVLLGPDLSPTSQEPRMAETKDSAPIQQ